MHTFALINFHMKINRALGLIITLIALKFIFSGPFTATSTALSQSATALGGLIEVTSTRIQNAP